MSTIKAAGGLCAPIDGRFVVGMFKPDIFPNDIQRKKGWRKWFSWDKGWGFPLRGGYIPTMREMFPVVRASREPINYFKVAQ